MRSKVVALVLSLVVLFTAVPAYAAPERETAEGDVWDEIDCTKKLIMLKNYVETFKKRNYRWCSEHEIDEWEEEWFNSN